MVVSGGAETKNRSAGAEAGGCGASTGAGAGREIGPGDSISHEPRGPEEGPADHTPTQRSWARRGRSVLNQTGRQPSMALGPAGHGRLLERPQVSGVRAAKPSADAGHSQPGPSTQPAVRASPASSACFPVVVGGLLQGLLPSLSPSQAVCSVQRQLLAPQGSTGKGRCAPRTESQGSQEREQWAELPGASLQTSADVQEPHLGRGHKRPSVGRPQETFYLHSSFLLTEVTL